MLAFHFQDDNSNLVTKIGQLEEKIAEISGESEEKEKSLQEKLENAKSEHLALEDKLKNTSNLLETLQAKSPEVGTMQTFENMRDRRTYLIKFCSVHQILGKFNIA